jgi:hypothetical protein
MCDDMLAAGVVGVIIQAITGLDGISYTRQQLAKAIQRGLRIAGYVWGFGATSVASRLKMFDGFPLEWLGYDCEDDSVTVASVDRDLKLCDAYMPGKLTEFYSGWWFFARKKWLGVSRWANRWLWDAIYDQDPEPSHDFVPYGGWTMCRTKQFWDKQVFGGAVVDINFRLTDRAVAA